ncbi:RHS repeat-associated protein [Chitinophaga ginsengisoli]|uniref:RHS repeat-associated protein n=1 Tax=Chitinophaga ginsengisoli TaxID=363837 RepID=A0A2P8F949_9BACT|nr:RHS repeat-associated protein [Chitinophaga ginsengisoli]
MKGEGNQQDYGMRVYDPRIAKFLSVDPLTPKYPELTPYQFASNRPIDGVDIDGLEWGPPMKFDPKTRKWVVDGDAAIAIHTHPNNLLGLVIAADILVTKGWLSRAFMGVQAASVFEHNTAKTPEAKALQKERTNEAFTQVFLSWGVSKIIGTTIRLLPLAKEIKYLFRGTSEGYEGSRATQITASTPTSTDPAKATIFALRSKEFGNGILQIVLPKNLQNVEVGATSNVLGELESEVVVGLKPAELTSRAEFTITADEARNILGNMGIKLPARVKLDDISNLLRETPQMTQSQIDEFYKQAASLKVKK